MSGFDPRPKRCRFRLQEEGQGYPRSSCWACGKSIATGLGTECTAYGYGNPEPAMTPDQRNAVLEEAAKVADAKREYWIGMAIRALKSTIPVSQETER